MTPTKKTAAPKKTPAKKVVADEAADVVAKPAGEYIYAIGRRKRGIAKVKVWMTGKGEISVNGKPHTTYFPVYELSECLTDPLKVVGRAEDVTIAIETLGGGLRGQAEASRLGISRALIEFNPEFRKSLKKLGYLMRDPREKERKHYGFKKARKASQWAKR